MGKYYVTAEIEAPNLYEAWSIAANLPQDLSPAGIPAGVNSFSITEESTNREFSFNSYNEEESN